MRPPASRLPQPPPPPAASLVLCLKEPRRRFRLLRAPPLRRLRVAVLALQRRRGGGPEQSGAGRSWRARMTRKARSQPCFAARETAGRLLAWARRTRAAHAVANWQRCTASTARASRRRRRSFARAAAAVPRARHGARAPQPLPDSGFFGPPRHKARRARSSKARASASHERACRRLGKSSAAPPGRAAQRSRCRSTPGARTLRAETPGWRPLQRPIGDRHRSHERRATARRACPAGDVGAQHHGPVRAVGGGPGVGGG